MRIRPNTVKRHLADLQARTGLSTEQLIYAGRADRARRLPARVWPLNGSCSSARISIVNLSRSNDGGRTWSSMGRADDKTASGCAGSRCYALYPTVVGGPANTVYLAWMDDRSGQPLDHTNGFNVWLRTSTSGGATWTGPSREISAYDPTQSQSTSSGFLFPYGDYMGLAMTSCGAPLLTWGEGHNWVGGPSAPGHIEFRTLC